MCGEDLGSQHLEDRDQDCRQGVMIRSSRPAWLIRYVYDSGVADHNSHYSFGLDIEIGARMNRWIPSIGYSVTWIHLLGTWCPVDSSGTICWAARIALWMEMIEGERMMQGRVGSSQSGGHNSRFLRLYAMSKMHSIETYHTHERTHRSSKPGIRAWASIGRYDFRPQGHGHCR